MKKIAPTDLRVQAQQLTDFGRMPSLAEVLKAVSETRLKYRPMILTARKDKASR